MEVIHKHNLNIKVLMGLNLVYKKLKTDPSTNYTTIEDRNIERLNSLISVIQTYGTSKIIGINIANETFLEYSKGFGRETDPVTILNPDWMTPTAIVNSMNNYVNLIRSRIRSISATYSIPPIGYVDGNKFFANNFNYDRPFFPINIMQAFLRNLDFIGVNMHPIYYGLFDPSTNGNAINWWDSHEYNFNRIKTNVLRVKPTMDIIIAEVGWPTAGTMYGSHTFTMQQQRTYINTAINWCKRQNIKFYWHSMFDNQTQIDGVYSQSWGLFYCNFDKITQLWNLSPKYSMTILRKYIYINYTTGRYTYL